MDSRYRQRITVIINSQSYRESAPASSSSPGSFHLLLPNTLLQNRYLIVQPIGQGGMGAVYMARDQRLRSTVALKETSVSDDSLLKAFEHEAHLLASLRHPALPKVIDHFVESNGQFLVMEFIPGEDFGGMLERTGRPVSLATVLGWADQLLDALDYLHTHEPPIIHRDIKPQNLKLTNRGQVILLDFGLAKGTVGHMSRVSGRSVFGYTPHYAPLEQIQGAGTDQKSDLYSLAATCYHLMTCVRPPDALARATSVLGGQPDPLRLANEITRGIPVDVAGVIQQAMDLNPAGRPSSAAIMRRFLGDVSHSPWEHLAPTVREPSPAGMPSVRQTAVKDPLLPSTVPLVERGPRSAEMALTIPTRLEQHSLTEPAKRQSHSVEPTPRSYRGWFVWSLAAFAVIAIFAGIASSVPAVALAQVSSTVVGLGMLICAIIVLIKLFQNEGALKGILGLICGLYALIWGWMNANKYGIKNIMIIWTLLIIVYLILGAMGGFNFSYSVGTPVAP